MLEGIYNISASIHINKRVTIIGQQSGSRGTELTLATAANCNMFELDPAVGATDTFYQLTRFEHIKLNGNRTGQGVNCTAIHQNAGSAIDMTFQDVWFDSWNGYCIDLQQYWDHHISRCIFEHNTNYAIHLNYTGGHWPYELWVRDCFYPSVLSDGDDRNSGPIFIQNNIIDVSEPRNNFDFKGVSNLTFTNNTTTPSAGARTANTYDVLAIRTTAGLTDINNIVIEGNNFYQIGDKYLIEIGVGGSVGPNRIIINGNNFQCSGGTAIVANTGTGQIANFIFSNNHLYGTADSSMDGVIVGNSNGSVISGNTFTFFANGVNISNAACLNPTVFGNTFSTVTTPVTTTGGSGTYKPLVYGNKVDNSTDFKSFGTVTGTQLISTIATGTAPFTVASTTQVANLNVATAGTCTGNAAGLSSTLAVGSGGTNNTTFTAYMPLAAGTTATGAFQSIATGTRYYPLCYNTSGSLPTFQVLPVAGGGTGATSASITAFNNITGYTATGATGTTSGKLVFDTSPTFVTQLTTPAISMTGTITNTSTSSQYLWQINNSATTGFYWDGTYLYYKNANSNVMYMGGASITCLPVVYGYGNFVAINSGDYASMTMSKPNGASGLITVSDARGITIDKPFFLTGLGAASAGTAMVLVAGTNEVRPLLSTKEQKDNIEPLDFDSSAIFKLQPVSFNWKESGERDFGLIAEDAYEVLPQLVNLDNGKPISIKYYTLSVLLLDQMKKQEDKITNQQKEIDDLKIRLTKGGQHERQG